MPSNLAWKVDRKRVPLDFCISLGCLVLELFGISSKIWETDVGIELSWES